jgi:hypothetical protein
LGVIAQEWPWSGLQLPPWTVAAHPATGCESDNNGEEKEATCKKVTGEDPSRQPALRSAAIELTGGKISSLFIDLKRGPKPSEPDALRLDAPDAG